MVIISISAFNFGGDDDVRINADCGGETACACGNNLVNDTSLTANLECTGVGINISDNNLTLNCAGYYVLGDGDAADIGISFYGLTNITLINCNISTFGDGIYALATPGVTIYNNSVWNHTTSGIKLWASNQTNITSNQIYQNYNGLVSNSSYQNITNNSFSNNTNYAFYISGLSTNNGTANMSIDNNTFINNNYGLYISEAVNTTIRGNNFSNNNYSFALVPFSASTHYLSYYIHNITTTNLINNKPIYYYRNQNNLEINESTGAGVIYIISSQNINISNINTEPNHNGLYIYGSDNLLIKDSNFSNNARYGIQTSAGINFNHNYNFTLVNITTNYNERGLWLGFLNDSLISNSTSSYNNKSSLEFGIYVYYSENNTIENNEVFFNYYAGIGMFGKGGNRYNNNTIGYTTCVSCAGIIALLSNNFSNNNLSNNSEGLQLGRTSNTDSSLIESNIMQNNVYGLNIGDSDKSNIINNTFLDNNYSIYLDAFGRSSSVTKNKIINNTINRSIQYALRNIDGTGNNFTGNIIQNSYDYSLAFSSGGTSSIVTNNTLCYNERPLNNATAIVFQNNTFCVVLGVTPEDYNRTTNNNFSTSANITDVFYNQTTNCTLSVDSSVHDSNITVTHANFTYFTSDTIAEGVHTWNVNCSDTAGNTGQSVTKTISRDNTAPSVEISLSSSAVNQYEKVTITCTATDTLDSNLTYKIKVSNPVEEFTEYSGVTSQIYSNTGIIGTYTVTCYSDDSLANTGSKSATFKANYRSPGSSSGSGSSSGVSNTSEEIDEDTTDETPSEETTTELKQIQEGEVIKEVTQVLEPAVTIWEKIKRLFIRVLLFLRIGVCENDIC